MSCMSNATQVRDSCLIGSPSLNTAMVEPQRRKQVAIQHPLPAPPHSQHHHRRRHSDDSALGGNLVRQVAANAAAFTSSNFHFPVTNNRISHLLERGAMCISEVYYFLTSTHALVHSDVLPLIETFLEIKRNYGNPVEKRLYRNMEVKSLITRLLRKRPLVFSGPKDEFLLRSGERGWGGFETIGTENERMPLILNGYLSYDEIKLAALLGMSSPTAFINDGHKDNRGVIEEGNGSFRIRGIIIGLSPPRFERISVMEYHDMVVDPSQNQAKNGFGDFDEVKLPGIYLMNQLWANFYKVPPFPVYSQLAGGVEEQSTSPIYLAFGTSGRYFNIAAYRRRIQLMAETLLLEANLRAAEVYRQAYVYVSSSLVATGVGSTRDEKLEHWYLEGFSLALARLNLSYIGVVAFADIGNPGMLKQLIKPKNEKIKVCVANNSPQAKFDENKDDDMLLVVSYAARSNAFPGNEYWLGSTNDSACCSSLIGELHNPLINPMILGENARILHLDYDDI